jgi:5-methylcytosine-specific restriction endonuclease McrA
MAQTPEQKRDWYRANKPAHTARARARNARHRNEIHALIDWHLSNHPCVDCGECDPVVLDFDHIVADKSFGLAAAVSGTKPLVAVVAEIAKCEIRCANCHRRKTHRTRGYRDKTVAGSVHEHATGEAGDAQEQPLDPKDQ